MGILEDRLWAGSETSLQAAIEAEAGAIARMSAGPEDDSEDEGPRLLSVADGIATIAIKGPLVNSDSPYLRYYGVCGYSEIREAMLAAANDPEVKHILLDVDSGGGAVSGCDDTGKLIRLINDKVKPVTTYADTMASAAYWLGCSAGKVYSGKASLVGSIGVISTFRSFVERNKMEGVEVTVLRAGKHKALANQNEKLSPAAEAQIQKLLDSAYGVFVDHVTAMRGGTYEMNDKTRADGQEFIGQAAVDVGLTDGIMTYDALITKIKKKILALEQKASNNTVNRNTLMYGSTSSETQATAASTNGDPLMAKKALTEADIIALAAGATNLDDEPNAEALAAATPTDAPVAHTEAVATAPVVDALAAECAVKAEVATIDATVQLLNSQLKEKDAALLEAGIKLAGLQAFKDQYEAVLQPLKDIVGRSASIMHIAQGGSTRDFAAMQPAELVAEHARLAVGFSKFPVGGVAAVATDFNAKNEHAPDAASQARLDAVRFSRKGA